MNFIVKKNNYNEIKNLFNNNIPFMVENKSIVEYIANNDLKKSNENKNILDFNEEFINKDKIMSTLHDANQIEFNDEIATGRDKQGIFYLNENNEIDNSVIGQSERVVRSHLNYMYKYEPFRQGIFNYETLYGYLFFMVIEKRLKISYTMRVLKTILTYVRSRGNSVNNNLTNESKMFINSHPKGMIVKLNRFYQIINKIGDASGNDEVKRLIVVARSARPLVFTEKEDSDLVNYCINIITDISKKYLNESSYGFSTSYDFSTGSGTNKTLSYKILKNNKRKKITFVINNTDENEMDVENSSMFIDDLNDDSTNNNDSDNVDDYRNINFYNNMGENIDGDLSRNNDAEYYDKKNQSGTIRFNKRNIEVYDGLYNFVNVKNDKILYEFALAFVLGFLTGARIKSVLLKLKIKDVVQLLEGKNVECLTKGAFAMVFLPPQLLKDERNKKNTDDAFKNNAFLEFTNTFDDDKFNLLNPKSNDTIVDVNGDITNIKNIVKIRTDTMLYDSMYNENIDNNYFKKKKGGVVAKYLDDDENIMYYDANGKQIKDDKNKRNVGNGHDYVNIDLDSKYFQSTPRQLELCFDRVYTSLFSKEREKGVRWHSQRRSYLGEINSKYGLLTASKSVGHSDIQTTMGYVNKSQHHDDTNMKAGTAIINKLKKYKG